MMRFDVAGRRAGLRAAYTRGRMKTLTNALDSFSAGDSSFGTLLRRMARISPGAYRAHAADWPDWMLGAACFGFEQSSLREWRALDRAARPELAAAPFSAGPDSFADELAAASGLGRAGLEALTDRWATRADVPPVPLASVGVADARVREAWRALIVGQVRVPLLDSWWSTGALSALGAPRRGQMRAASLGPCGFVLPTLPVSYGPGDVMVTVFRPTTGVYLTFGRGAPLGVLTCDGDVIVRLGQRVRVEAVVALGEFHPPVEVLFS